MGVLFDDDRIASEATATGKRMRRKREALEMPVLEDAQSNYFEERYELEFGVFEENYGSY